MPIFNCDQAGAAPRDVLLVLDFSGGHGDEAVDYAAPALRGVLHPKDRVAATRCVSLRDSPPITNRPASAYKRWSTLSPLSARASDAAAYTTP